MPERSLLVDDAEWEILADDWWRTPLSTSSLSWTYSDAERPSKPLRSSRVTQRTAVPHYHDTLLRLLDARPEWKECCGECQEVRDRLCPCDATKAGGGKDGVDLELNEELVGVRIALEVIRQFERSVAISTAEDDLPDFATLARRVHLLHSDLPQSTLPREDWSGQVDALLGGIVARLDPEVFRAAATGPPLDIDKLPAILDLDLNPKPSSRRKRPKSLEIIDLTDSEQSVESEPAPRTPKPFNSAVDDQADGKLPKLHIPRVPSSPSSASLSPPTSDELQSESSSHTRSSSLPPNVDLRKDQEGFFVPMGESSEEAALMPSFLVDASARVRKPHSRTREIIDRLRGARPKTAPVPEADAPEDAPPSASPTRPSREDVAQSVKRMFQVGQDGWIRMTADAAEAKDGARRISDPFINPAEDSDSEDSSLIGASLRSGPSTKKKSAPAKPKPQQQSQQSHNRRASATEGWIDTSASAPPRQHRASQSLASLYPPASVGVFTFPPPPAHATPQSQPQPQPQPGAYQPPAFPGYRVPPYPAPPGFVAVAYPAPLPPPGGPVGYGFHGPAYPYMPAYGGGPPRPQYTAGPITGATGIRHAGW